MTALLLMLLAAIVAALHLLAPAPVSPARAERPLRLTVMPFAPTPRPTATVTVIDGVPVPPGAVLVTPRPPERPTPPTPED